MSRFLHLSVCLLVLLALVCGVAQTAPTVKARDWNDHWLFMMWHDHTGGRVTLTIEKDGWVWFDPPMAQRGRGFGLYMFQLPAARFTEVQRTINAAAVDWPKGTIADLMMGKDSAYLELLDGKMGKHKFIPNNDPRYAKVDANALRAIFDLSDPEHPRGLLWDMMNEAREQSSILFNVHTEVPKGPFIVGGKIPVISVIENIGTLAVEFPITKWRSGGYGYLSVTAPSPYWRDPEMEKGKASFIFDPKLHLSGGAIINEGKTRLLRIEPGETVRFKLSTPVVVKQRGAHDITVMYFARPLYTYQVAQPQTKYTKLVMELWHPSVRVTVK